MHLVVDIPADHLNLKEGTSEEWVLPRLKRAGKDETDDSLLHSRYAVWASSVNDLVENATRSIRSQDSAEALRQLGLAASVIKAYRDIQTIFDNEHSYKTSQVFTAYASHLLNIEGRGVETYGR